MPAEAVVVGVARFKSTGLVAHEGGTGTAVVVLYEREPEELLPLAALGPCPLRFRERKSGGMGGKGLTLLVAVGVVVVVLLLLLLLDGETAVDIGGGAGGSREPVLARGLVVMREADHGIGREGRGRGGLSSRR